MVVDDQPVIFYYIHLYLSAIYASHLSISKWWDDECQVRISVDGGLPQHYCLCDLPYLMFSDKDSKSQEEIEESSSIFSSVPTISISIFKPTE